MATLPLHPVADHRARRTVRRAADRSFLEVERKRPLDVDDTRPSMSIVERVSVAVLWAFLVALVVVEIGAHLG